MMRSKILCTVTLVLLMMCALHSSAQSTREILPQKMIAELCDSSWVGRPTGPATSKLFHTWVNKYKSNVSLQTQRFSYLKDGSKIFAKNFLLSSKKNAVSHLYIIAHYDHLGSGGIKSKEVNKTCIHPGADDNASGVALALMLFDSLQKNFAYLQPTIVYTSGHEDGMYGSKALAKLISNKLYPYTWIINLDMVGRLDTISKKIRVETNILWPDVMTDNIMPSVQQIHSVGEHSAFLQNNLWVTFITTGSHNDYHRCTDTPDKINIEGIENLRNYLIAVIAQKIQTVKQE